MARAPFNMALRIYCVSSHIVTRAMLFGCLGETLAKETRFIVAMYDAMGIYHIENCVHIWGISHEWHVYR